MQILIKTNKITISLVFAAYYLLFSSLCAAEISQNPSSSTNSYQNMKYERVVDGDTFIASGKRVRLWGINAPEKGRPLYDLSTKFLEALIEEGNLRCKFLYMDRFRRDVMHCSIDKVDVGSVLVKWGMATDFEKYSDGFYEVDQKHAQSRHLGIWH